MEIDNILEVSNSISNDRTVKDILCKAIEELGEVATEINKGTPREAQREIADTIIVLVDLHHKLSVGVFDSSIILSADIETKLIKWKKVYGGKS